MPRLSEFFYGAELIWLMWTALVPVWVTGTVWLFRRVRLRNPLTVWRDESGLSYTLAFVLTVPLYLLLCCVFCEVTLLLLAKFGTVYAAYAGARSAVVWETMSPGMREDRVREAVVVALTPFAVQGRNSGSPEASAPWGASSHADDYVQALQKFSGSEVRREKLKRHFLDVAGRTSVKTRIREHKRGAPVEVTVTYRAAFLTPGVARLLDPDHAWPYEYPITSSTTLNLEYPVSRDGRLGINYKSF